MVDLNVDPGPTKRVNPGSHSTWRNHAHRRGCYIRKAFVLQLQIDSHLLNELSAEATVTGMVRNTLNATTKFGNNESRFL